MASAKRNIARSAVDVSDVSKRIKTTHVEPYGIRTKPFCEVLSLQVAEAGPYAEHTLKVTYTNTPAEVEAFFERNAVMHYGFDVEHKPTFRPGQKANLSLIQLAPLVETEDPECLVYSLYHNNGDVPPTIRELLSSPSARKYGVGVKGDLQHLKYMELHPTVRPSFVDLAPLAFAKNLTTRKDVGLKELVTTMMGPEVALYKSKKLTMTNWETRALTEAQIRYAAMDAYCAIECLRLIEQVEGPV